MSVKLRDAATACDIGPFRNHGTVLRSLLSLKGARQALGLLDN